MSAILDAKLVRALAIGALSVFSASALAQNVASFPSKPIRMIIPFAPGGGTDITGRTVGAELTKAWGQPVVADNEAGANGTIGIAQGAKAAPDGYTLILISASSLINQHVLAKVPYDLLRDFAPLSQLTAQPYALVVNPAVPAKSLKELIAYAKANPGKLNYGSSGVGGTSHLSGALFAQMAGINITHVPYKGGNPAMLDVIAGNIQMLYSTLLQAGPHLKSGKLRVLAVSTAQRAPAAPDVPTMSEAGVPGYEVAPWYGLIVPAKTPQPIIGKLNSEIARIMKSPEVAPKLAADGSQGIGGTPAEFGALLKAENVKWAKLVKEIGLKAD
jgi:tripartite-type tricarboxylate transporter receptor subunit TctC